MSVGDVSLKKKNKRIIAGTMFVSGEVCGVIGIKNEQHGAYNEDEIELSQALAHHVMFATHGFFFFQAEDGIRDDLVTGVQTCALPICPRDPSRSPGTACTAHRAAGGTAAAAGCGG